MKPVNIYTDGACSGNQNQENTGGWGAVLEYGSHKKELSGGELNTTNNRMELSALLSALQALTKEGLDVRVFSDSSYLVNCFRERWYEGWRRSGWKNSKKAPVENRDLWEPLLALTERHSVSFYRVKGHVSLKQTEAKLTALYEKFVEWNGTGFTMDDFLYITEMNNRADALATAACPPMEGAEGREAGSETDTVIHFHPDEQENL